MLHLHPSGTQFNFETKHKFLSSLVAQAVCEKAKAAGVMLVDVTAVPRITIAHLSWSKSGLANMQTTQKSSGQRCNSLQLHFLIASHLRQKLDVLSSQAKCAGAERLREFQQSTHSVLFE